jgi:hypothetical protein
VFGAETVGATLAALVGFAVGGPIGAIAGAATTPGPTYMRPGPTRIRCAGWSNMDTPARSSDWPTTHAEWARAAREELRRDAKAIKVYASVACSAMSTIRSTSSSPTGAASHRRGRRHS